ncbi:MAG TPA: ATP-binding protein [Prolixibacteraceae bacterium]|nr:ATP-binding protein [Prolixibacteraceae bacterium]
MINQLEQPIDWFSAVIETAIQLYFQQECPVSSIEELGIPEEDYFGEFIAGEALSLSERIVLMLAIVPHIRPQLLDTFFIQNKNLDRPFTEFGGWKGNTHGGFLPTGETASFIYAGLDIGKRIELIKLFDPEHRFARQNILRIEKTENGEPFLSGVLQLYPEFLTLITTGQVHKPDYSILFPAKRITTLLEWDDLVLPYQTLSTLDDINTWIQHSEQITSDSQLRRYITPGYRALFYGPPGTGKTLTASLIGKKNNRDVYRIDLSMLVSKYIGETEKNLANVFDRASNKEWILFFDEADALFGKRTQTNTSNDRYANQEVAYLLQRIEDFPGIVLLATNLKTNLDDAFLRRFQSSVSFPMPDPQQRLQLWENMLPDRWLNRSNANLKKIADDYELAGGSIANIIRYTALKLIQKNSNTIDHEQLLEGIRKELSKDGKIA